MATSTGCLQRCSLSCNITCKKDNARTTRSQHGRAMAPPTVRQKYCTAKSGTCRSTFCSRNLFSEKSFHARPLHSGLFGMLRECRHGAMASLSADKAQSSTAESGMTTQEWPLPTTSELSVEQARGACQRAIADGKTRLQIELLLPLIGATDLDDWPGGIRQQFQAAVPLVYSLLRGLVRFSSAEASKRYLLDEADAVGVWEGADVALVLFPNADTVPDLQRLAETERPTETERAAETELAKAEAKGAAKTERAGAEKASETERTTEPGRAAEPERTTEPAVETERPIETELAAVAKLVEQTEEAAETERTAETERVAETERTAEAERAAESGQRPLVIMNPQWREGQVVSDFGFGARKRSSEEFLATFEPAYILQQRRIQGEDVRVLRCYPGPYQIYLTDGRGKSDLLSTSEGLPSYKEIDALLSSRVGSRANKSWLEKLVGETKFNFDNKF